MKYRAIIVLFALWGVHHISACPFFITNDGSVDIMVSDPYHRKSVVIEPGETETIDPTIASGWRFLRHEMLDFYVEDKTREDRFCQRYRLIEYYCTKNSNENKLKLSDIERLSKQPPTNRLRIKAYPGCPAKLKSIKIKKTNNHHHFK